MSDKTTCPRCGNPDAHFDDVKWDHERNAPVVRCADCRRHHEQVQRQERADLLTSEDCQVASGIPPQYVGATVADVPGVADALERLLTEDHPGVLTLSGPPGTGKTRLAYALKLRALAEWGRVIDGERVVCDRCEFHRAALLLKRLQGLCGESPADEGHEINRLATLGRLLLLDDLGAEKVTDFCKASFYCILAEREEWGRPTLVTTNLTAAELAERFDPRVASRLAVNWIALRGKDRRLG